MGINQQIFYMKRAKLAEENIILQKKVLIESNANPLTDTIFMVRNYECYDFRFSICQEFTTVTVVRCHKVTGYELSSLFLSLLFPFLRLLSVCAFFLSLSLLLPRWFSPVRT